MVKWVLGGTGSLMTSKDMIFFFFYNSELPCQVSTVRKHTQKTDTEKKPMTRRTKELVISPSILSLKIGYRNPV